MDVDFGLGDLLKGGSEEIRNWIEWRRKNRQDQQPKDQLDEMLRNPRWRLRETTTLAAEINDTTDDYKITRTLLRQMGASHNHKPGGKDTWWMRKYWEQTPGGSWKLKKKVKPGNS